MNVQITIPVDSTRGSVVSTAHADSDQLAFLNLYRVYHQILGEDENQALGLVEVERAGYAEIGVRMGKTANEIKLLVLAARRKLLFGMGRTLAELDQHPAA